MINLQNSILEMSAAIIAFVVAAVLGKFVIPLLNKINFGQTILEVGPKWHKKKQGTPTMGGIIFIIGILISFAACMAFYFYKTKANGGGISHLSTVKVIAGLAMALCFGFIGFIDDYIKVVKKRNLGLTAKQKLILQFIVAGAYFLTIFLAGGNTSTFIPFVGSIDLGIFYWIISAIFIVGMINAVNFTDGLDGLNASVTFFVCMFFMIIANIYGLTQSSILASSAAGGCLGFLVWNFYPAKVFMGDMGSLFLGGMVCALAFSINTPVILILLGLIYIIEIVSVVIQVSYFKLTHGKRLFKMTPIHHHFEMCGFSEVKIIMIFSLVTIILGALCVLACYFG